MQEINASRPEIFGSTINKKTVSKKTNNIKYEHAHLSQENRVFVENVANDTIATKLPAGYNASPIIKETVDFKKRYPQLSWCEPDLLYERIMNDARNVVPRNRELKLLVTEFYERMLYINLNNIYNFAPRFFTDNFMPKSGVNNAAFESYQAYLYLLCFINYVDEHRADPDVVRMDNIDIIADWVSVRRDPNIPFIIRGPSTNSDMSGSDFRAHYKSLISPSNNVSDILQYNQLSTMQTVGSDLFKMFAFMQANPNVFIKTPDEARKYNVNIDSSEGVLVNIDSSNNLIFDCSYVNLGDTIERSGQVRYNDLESASPDAEIGSVINIRKLANLFHNYSRIRIVELVIAPDTFISSLDSFRKVFVVFRGVNCSERNVYNNISLTDLKFGGSFLRTNRGYEFKQDVDVITYKSALADVKNFEIYITSDPGGINKIIPNEYILKCSKNDVYQHPVTSGVIIDTASRNNVRVFVPEYAVTHGSVLPSFDYKDGARYNREKYINQLKDVLSVQNKQTTADGCYVQLESVKRIVHEYTIANNPKTYSYILNLTLAFIDNLMKDFKKWSLAYNAAYLNELTDEERAIFDIITKNHYNDLSFTFSPNTNLKTLSLFNILQVYDYIAIRDILIKCIEYIEPDFSKADFLIQTASTNPIPASIDNKYNQDPVWMQIILNANNLSSTNSLSEYRKCADAFRELMLPLIFSNTDPSSNVFIADITDAMSLFVDLESYLSKWYESKYDIEISKQQLIRYKTLQIDSTKGTINGKYFRIDTDGNVVYTDSFNIPFSSPDERYVAYSIEENDLCLYNLLKIIGGNIYNTYNGSFIYSEALGVISNLPTIINSLTDSAYRYTFDNQYYVQHIYNNVAHDAILVPTAYAETPLFKHWNSFANYTTPTLLYRTSTHTYTRTSDSLPFQDPPTVNYHYVKITNDNIIDQSSDHASVLASNIDTEFLGKQPSIEYTNYPDPLHKIVTVEHCAAQGTSDINMFYVNHNTKLQEIYNNDAWKIIVEIEDDPIENTAEESLRDIVVGLSVYIDGTVDQTITSQCTINTSSATVTGVCTLMILNGDIYGTGFAYNLTYDGNDADNISDVRMFAFKSIIANINSDMTLQITSIRNVTLKYYRTTRAKLKSVSICDVFNNKFDIEREININCALFNSLDEIVYSAASHSTTDIYGNTIRIEYSYVEPNLMLNHTFQDISSGVTRYNKLLLNVTDATMFIESYNSNVNTQRERLELLRPTSSIIPLCATTASFNNNIVGLVINNEYLNKYVSYEQECNAETSNLYKAYSVNGIDTKNNYWNKTMYINSLLFTILPIDTPLLDIDSIERLVCDSSDKNTFLFTRSGDKLKRIYGRYTILKNIILVLTNNLLVNSGLENLIVFNIGQTLMSTEVNAIKYNAAEVLIQQVSINIGVSTGYVVILTIEHMNIVGMHLYKKCCYKNYDSVNHAYNDCIDTTYVGSYQCRVMTGYSIYIGEYNVIVNYVNNNDGLFIKDVSVSHVDDEVYEYVLANHVVKRRKLFNIKYSNVPAAFPTATDDIFTLNVISDRTFKYFPCIRYTENIFVSPTFIDAQNRLATIVRKRNQNITLEPASVKALYTNDTSTSAAIAKQINPASTYLLESIDNQTLMLGNIPKIGLIGNLAIDANNIYIIPRASKMNLTFEFS